MNRFYTFLNEWPLLAWLVILPTAGYLVGLGFGAGLATLEWVSRGLAK
jgi:hypothetical protein